MTEGFLSSSSLLGQLQQMASLCLKIVPAITQSTDCSIRVYLLTLFLSVDVLTGLS